MTRSSNHSDADYTPRDIGVPDRMPAMSMWKKHTPEWEGLSNEEKQKWLLEHPGEDFSVDYTDLEKDTI